MAYPAGYSSDEDDYDKFLTDNSGNKYEHYSENKKAQSSLRSPSDNLYYAITSRNVSQVVSILEGVDVNVLLLDGWSPIMLAASMGILDITKELIKRGANVNSHKDKHTVLMAVCSCPETTATVSECLDIVTTLIENGVQVDAIDKNRKTALMFAASNGCVEIVKKLITVCNIELEDNQSWNALFWAVTSSKSAVVKILLEEGLDIKKVDVRRNTVITYAIPINNEEILELLSLTVTEDPGPERVYNCELMFDGAPTTTKLQFLVDIYSILYAVKCEHHYEKFREVNLVDFLSLNSEKLTELGIIMPHEQNRILAGLFKFHQHVYKKISIHVVPQNSIYTTIDLQIGLLCAIRQILAMEASIKYVVNNFNNENGKFCEQVAAVRSSIRRLNQTAIRLNKLTLEWDYQNRPVDLITSKNGKQLSNWWKTGIIVSVISISSFILCKF